MKLNKKEKDYNKLVKACIEQNLQKVKKLINNGVDVNYVCDDSSVLLQSTVKSNSTIVAFLLSRSANVNFKNKSNETPLMIAAQTRNINIIELLLSCGANVNAVCDKGYTALLYACYYRDVNIIETLLTFGSDVNAACEKGYTPLMIACHHHNLNIISTLLMYGADVNATCNKGYTALMIAIKSRSYDILDIVELLIHHGADKTIKNKEGLDALHYANSVKHDIVNVLK